MNNVILKHRNEVYSIMSNHPFHQKFITETVVEEEVLSYSSTCVFSEVDATGLYYVQRRRRKGSQSVYHSNFILVSKYLSIGVSLMSKEAIR